MALTIGVNGTACSVDVVALSPVHSCPICRAVSRLRTPQGSQGIPSVPQHPKTALEQAAFRIEETEAVGLLPALGVRGM